MFRKEKLQIIDGITHPDIVQPILTAHPNTQAIYLYGTWGTEYQRPDSDLDIAVLLSQDGFQNTDRGQWHLPATKVTTKMDAERYKRIHLEF